MTKENKIIIALDYDNSHDALSLVDQLGSACDFYKVGLQLLTASGPEVVRQLVDSEKRVFLDLKAFEIPNSVAGAVDSAGALGASLVTVHATAGRRALEAAAKAAERYPNLSVLAVTVVTSMMAADLSEVGVHSTVKEQVDLLAKLAVESGCDGLVASAHEVGELRSKLPERTLLVTPGIQLEETESNDQARVASPRRAIQSGANLLVIGRAITRANDPQAAFARATAQTL